MNHMTPAPLTVDDLRQLLIDEILMMPGISHGKQTRWANKYNCSPARVSEFLNGGKPTRDILRALGAEERVTVTYRIKE